MLALAIRKTKAYKTITIPQSSPIHIMKTLALVFFLLAFHLHATAQIRKGMVYLGGTISGNSTKDTEEQTQYYSYDSTFQVQSYTSTQNYVRVAPSVGYFATDSWLVGLGLSYSRYFSKYNYSYDSSFSTNNSNSWGISPYVTKYFSTNSKLYITTTLNASAWVGRSTNKSTYKSTSGSESHSNDWGYSISAGPGLTYFINSSWAVSANIGQASYRSSHSKYSSGQLYINPNSRIKNENGFGLDFSFNSFSIGIQYFMTGFSNRK